jgi:hypothetical protein
VPYRRPPSSSANCQLFRNVADGRPATRWATIAAAASSHSQTAVATRFAATGRDTTAQYATTRPRAMPISAYPAAAACGVAASDRTAAPRAGNAISATVSSAPAAAAAAIASRRSAPGRPASAPRSRPATTAPNTVELAAVHVAQLRLPSQTLSSAPRVSGHTTTPRPYPRPSWAAPAPAATAAAAPSDDVLSFPAMAGTVAVGGDRGEPADAA